MCIRSRRCSEMIFLFFSSIIFTISNFSTTQADCPSPLKDCSRDRVKFFLYTCKEGEPPQELILSDPKSITDAKFIEDADFKFLIHGYNQWKNAPTWITVREEYCKQKPWNMFVVDYSPVGIRGCYFDTLNKSKTQIGDCIADLLKLVFQEHPKITIDRFHFVGFSMGSQICAQVSNSLKSSDIIIPRITGCDPAGPGFFSFQCAERTKLNKEHAKFVDTIHTNMGEAGVVFSNAHFDFYANDGTFQPGCDGTDPSCSHNRALKIFAESINTKVKFIAQKCDSEDAWTSDKKCTGDHNLKKEVGEHCTPPKSDDEMGIYQFDTNSDKPFAIAQPPPS